MGYCWTTALANMDSSTHKIIIEKTRIFFHFTSPSMDALSFSALIEGKYIPFQGQTHGYALALPSCSIQFILCFYIDVPCCQLSDFQCRHRDVRRSHCPHQSYYSITHTKCLSSEALWSRLPIRECLSKTLTLSPNKSLMCSALTAGVVKQRDATNSFSLWGLNKPSTSWWYLNISGGQFCLSNSPETDICSISWC